MTDRKMEAEIIFESHIPNALRRALECAGDEGFVASMPALLHARANADYDNVIWNTWFTANSEESVVTTPQGNHVIVAIHGGGIYATPSRFEKMYYASIDHQNTHGYTEQFAGKISRQEAREVLAGRMPDGTEVPVYPFEEFKQGISDLPIRYGVIIDYELARQSLRGYEDIEVLKDDPNMIVRAGGVEANAAYLDKFRDRHNTKLMGHWHPYNRIDPDQPQTRILFLAGNQGGWGSDVDDFGEYGYDSEYGLGGDASIGGMARYVALAPRDDSKSLRRAPFRKKKDKKSDDIEPEAAIIFGIHKPIALQRALSHAGEDGFVASMPQLIHARTHAPYDNILWNTWFSSYSEENVVTTPQGNHVVVVIHGGGIYASPARFEKMYYASTDHRSVHGYTAQFVGKISEREAHDVLEGRLPDGTEVPVYPFEEFKQGIADLPNRYGVILDYELARQSLSGYVEFEVLKDDPNMIVRTGGVAANAAYLDKFRDRHNTKSMGHWHPYNDINPEQPQTSGLFLAGNQGGRGSDVDDFDPASRTQREDGYNSETGLSGGGGMGGLSRYVAVAPRDVSTDVRNLDFGL